MKSRFRVKPITVFVAAAALVLFAIGAYFLPALAGDDDSQHEHETQSTGHSHDKASPHGGQVTMTQEFHVEVAFDRDAVIVYLYDSAQNPISAENVSATATLTFRDKDRVPVEVELVYVNPADEDDGDMAQDFLRADVDLSEVQEGDMKAVFTVTGLPGDDETEVTLKETFQLARIVTYECPMSCVAPGSAPGDCPKCGMVMVRTETIYACSMHPKVTSHDAEDKCWVCGMTVTPSDGNAEAKDDHSSHDH